MPFGRDVRSITTILCFFSVLLPASAGRAGDAGNSSRIRHHDLVVTIDPDRHRLAATDRMVLQVDQAQQPVFSLAKSLRVMEVVLVERERSIPLPFRVVPAPDDSSFQLLGLSLPAAAAGDVTVEWRYEGLINDPPREPRHLRFVTPSETAGHIGPEGTYLSSESGWYPDLSGSLASYALAVEIPDGWTTVSQGRGGARQDCSRRDSGGACVVRQTWESGIAEALTLVAGRFAVKQREWRDGAGRPVSLATYLFPEDAALADEYLEATAKYLDVYVPILGPYPFEQFAVVENFFASGLGMPSFTLLGSGSIKRHYVQPYALGHEIVHSWIGNSVWNRVESGNWVEGLTTYLANYYWHELAHDDRQAREQRRLMTQGYSLYVTPRSDYPVAEFQRKSDEKDNAIGYQKAAMVFHQLRMEIGDDAFWRGVKQVVQEYSGRHADWKDLEGLFARVSGKDLRWFFAQWVERAGAPQLSLVDASASPPADQPGAFRLHVAVRQEGEPFRVTVPVEVTMQDSVKTLLVPLAGSQGEVDVPVPSMPLSVSLDPQVMTLQRFRRDQLAPVLNLYVTDPRKSLLPLFPDGATPFQELVARIRAQEEPLAPERKTDMLPVDTTVLPASGSVLMVVTPEHRAQAQSLLGDSCGDRVKLEPTGFRIAGATYDGPAKAVLLSCHRAGVPGSVVTVLYAIQPAAAAKVARLLFFYGWHSVVIFSDGVVAQRDVWQVPQTIKEVRLNAQP
ncbi:M1 family metallopeptidase [Nitrospira sp. NS4]|uniref:M1 family metallopeptidase n=1 Tax=Nitrospira sp. NS4 TaxID=3414498 RepID=UPI003C2E458D